MTTPDPILSALIDVLNAARKTKHSNESLAQAIASFDRIAIDEGLKKWVENGGADEKCGLGCGPTERTCPRAKRV